MRKKKSQIMIATAVTTLAVVVGSTGVVYCVNAKEAKAGNPVVTVSTQATAGIAKNTSENAVSLSANTASENTTEKDETVYVITSADGSTKKVIVSDWLKNVLESGSIADVSELQNILNVKGDETFTTGDGNAVTWNAAGNDIYYQGTTDAELPITLNIKYQLDGVDITPEELVGKSGKLTITFTYTNNQSQTVKINGKDETIYVPYVVASGMIVNNDIFKNVEVENGKLINDGSKSVVVGFALPGLKESLDIDDDTIDIPESFTITADVTNYEAITTMSVATNELFNKIDTDKFSDIDSVDDMINQLTDATTQLVDGTSALYDGLSTLLEKSATLTDGVSKLEAGSNTLQDGTKALSENLVTLDNGLNSLDDGLEQLDANSDALKAGSKQVFESLLSVADSQLSAAGLKVKKLTIDNYSKVLDGVLENLDATAVEKLAYNTALSKVTAAVNAQADTIQSKVEQAVEAKVLEGVLQAAGQTMTATQYQQAVAAGKITDEMQAQISAAVKQQMATSAVEAQVDAAVEQQISQLIETNMKSDEVQEQIKAAKQQAASGASSIQALKTQLDSYNQFYSGLNTYVNGVSSANSAASQLSSGADKIASASKQLASGADTLADGLDTLNDSCGVLVDAVGQLTDGSLALRDGMNEFYETGINKITSLVDGDVQSFVDRISAIADASKSYTNFSGISNDMKGNVKFIFKTE